MNIFIYALFNRSGGRCSVSLLSVIDLTYMSYIQKLNNFGFDNIHVYKLDRKHCFSSRRKNRGICRVDRVLVIKRTRYRKTQFWPGMRGHCITFSCLCVLKIRLYYCYWTHTSCKSLKKSVYTVSMSREG